MIRASLAGVITCSSIFLVIALCAMMAGAEGWDDMEAWGEANEERLRHYLELPNGIPGHDTIRRVFEAIDPKRLEAVLLEWIGHVCPALGKVIAIDGKSVRSSGSLLRGQRALHVVSAYASEMGLVLGQPRCEEKSNEITAIEALLPNLALAGCIVTIDAMGYQTAIAAQAIERKGDYLLNAKENQPKLAEAIKEYIRIAEQHAWKNLAPSQFETLDKGHGRVETRRCVALPVPDYIPEIKRWPGIQSIARIEAVREAQGKMTTEVRYLIGSMSPDAHNTERNAAALGHREWPEPLPGRGISRRREHRPPAPGCGEPGYRAQTGAQPVPARYRQQTELAAQAQGCCLEAGLPVRSARPTTDQWNLMLRP
jgi:predicted transposase YbfD/YdcC